MSGKISNHKEMADGDLKIKDNIQEPSVAEEISSDVKKKSGIKEDIKIVNGINKDDFDNSKKNCDKEKNSNVSKMDIDNVSDGEKIENGSISSEFIQKDGEAECDDELNNKNKDNELNGVTNEDMHTNKTCQKNHSNISNENIDKNEEKIKNGIESIEQKDDIKKEGTTSVSDNTKISNKDSTTFNEKAENSAVTCDAENTTVKVNTCKTKSEKVKEEAKYDDENNDVIIIESTEGVSRGNKENSDTTQKCDAKNAAQKFNKSQTGAAQMIKSDSQSSATTSSPASTSLSSSSAPSIGDTSMTAFARLLHDLGVELVRQHVYKDLVEIQVLKDAQNKLNEREKEQLAKLEEFYAKQEIRNAPYNLKEYTVRCKCRVFASESKNVMRLHQEYGRIESGSVHVCCCCKEFKSRWPSHYITHMKSDHNMVGRLRKKMSPYRCSFCSYEAKNQLKIDTHMITCSKRFVLACNLQPLPADTDIPLKRRFIQTISYPSTQNRYSNYMGNNNSSSSNSNNTGYTSLYNNNQSFQSYYNQNNNSNNNRSISDSSNRNVYNNMSNNSSILSQQQQQAAKDSRSGVAKMEICEICGSNIFSRAALLNHLQIMHKVKLNTARGSTEPIMSCDRCPARFWTYQGLAKHATMVHKGTTSSSSMLSNNSNSQQQSGMHGGSSSSGGNRVPPVCHICGDSQTFNPLNHMSTRHNITLLDMYQVKQCYICNKALKNGPNFQEHMVLYHRDIFANKDVLHTVLQALSAARHLKREESSQPASSSSSSSSSNFNKYKKSSQSLTSTPVSSLKSGVFAQGGMSSASKSGAIKRRTSQVSPSSITKPPEKEKKSTEEERIEMEKLYENLAGIGRPILRSMKQRMSSGTGTSSTTSASLSSANPSNNAASTTTSSTSSPSIQSSSVSNATPKKSADSSKQDNSNNGNTNSTNSGLNKGRMNSVNHSTSNNYSNKNQSTPNETKDASLDRNGVQDLKAPKVQQQQQQASSSSVTAEPETKRPRVDESVLISDSN